MKADLQQDLSQLIRPGLRGTCGALSAAYTAAREIGTGAAFGATNAPLFFASVDDAIAFENRVNHLIDELLAT